MSYAQIINRCWFFCEYGLYQHVLTNRSKECETLWKVWNICVKSAMFKVPRQTNCFTWNNCHEKMVLRQAQELTKSAMFKVPRQTNCFTWNNCKIIPRAKSKGRIVVVLRFYSETSDFYSKCFTWNICNHFWAIVSRETIALEMKTPQVVFLRGARRIRFG